MALEIVDALVRSGAFDAIVLDSVPALYSPVRDQEAVDARNESLERARLLSDAMRRLAANVDRTRTVVLFGNDERSALTHMSKMALRLAVAPCASTAPSGLG